MKKLFLSLAAMASLAFAAPAAAQEVATLTYNGTVSGTSAGQPFAGTTVFTGTADNAQVTTGTFDFTSFLFDFGGTQYSLANASASFSGNTLSILQNGTSIFGYTLLSPFEGNQNDSFNVALVGGSAFTVSPNIGEVRIAGGAGVLTSSVTAAVPEPGTWAMMLLGFGAVGGAMRRQRKARAIPQFA